MPRPADSIGLLRSSYAADLAATGALTDPAWQSVFATVARHEFVPTFYRATTGDDGTLTHERITAPNPEWLPTVYSDQALSVRRDVTSASTSPSLMARMLESLHVTGDEHVLEIGTGTGYNAALLCERLGSDQVTSIDIDAELIDRARTRLTAAGYRPAVAVADGALGHPAGAPYDRIIATCRTDVIPLAWTDQLAPGGVIVAPIGTGIAVLADSSTIDPARRSWTGRFENYYSYFMPMRAHHDRDQLAAAARRAATDEGAINTAIVPVTAYESRDERFWLDLAIPGIVRGSCGDGGSVDLVYHQDGSWARIEGSSLTQGGAHHLWSDVEARHQEWNRHGRPGPDRIGITLESDLQTIWLDHPEHIIRQSWRT